MADERTQRKSSRNRRANVKKYRQEDIYCYDIPQNQEKGQSNQIQQQLKSDDDAHADDDSFSYNGPKPKKLNQNKTKGNKEKLKLNGKKNAKNGDEEDKPSRPKKQQSNKANNSKSNGMQYYSAGSSKQIKDIKIFNPVSYEENIMLKNRYEKELEQIYNQYGKKVGKSEEPPMPSNNWNFLLKQIEEAGKDFASQRQQRIKLKRKIAKFSQSFCNRIEQIKQQKIKDQERMLKRQSLDLMRLVKRKFWGSVLKVRRIVLQQQKKKTDKQQKMKKLQDLVARQFQASQKITKVLEGYQQVSLQNIVVSQTTRVPVIINIDKKPKYKYAGLHQDNVIRPSLLIKFPLREYQLLGVYWIYTLHNRGLNAILADQMGLGKTIQTIALLAHLAMEKGVWGPHLVIVPTTILMNWQIQFKRWCPAFKIMTYFGSPKQRKAKRKGWSKLNSFHVCITSYKIAVTDNPIFRRKKWYYMVLDEAQNIKNFKSQRWQILLNFKARHRLLLTGTPLQNDLTELWSLLHFLMPKIFNSFDDFNQWFNLPFQQALQKNFPISQQILKKLHTVLRPFFLRRLKKDVQTQLPKKTESIVRCGMSRRQKYLYDEMIWHENRRFKNHQSAGMMNVLMGLKKICNHPDLFQPRIQQTPFNWPPFTMVIAHHMFLKVHFETYKTHILRDFVDNYSARFEAIADDILKQYSKLDINQNNERYYKHKYMDRLAFAQVNYERSKRKQFRPYTFDFNKFVIVEQKTPYFMSKTISQRATQFQSIFDKFLFVVPRVMATPAVLATFPMSSQVQAQLNRLDYLRNWARKAIPIQLQRIRARFLLHFPNKSIILYDSGKLVKMVLLLKSIKYRGQKALVFTQMTKMLDIFQKVLNMFKFNYVRLDGNTKTQLRQTIVQRFNNDPRILCFISSTRSGGIGLNLTGASNVIFYDTDWNPAMDKQAQDRCHRIGQTRDVTIYRLITQYSIEQNILMKSIHKRKLQSLVTEQGMFDTSYFEKVSLKGLLQGAIDYDEDGADQQGDLAQVQDQQDRALLQAAEKQGKQANKDDQQQQLQTQMLPGLFKYGLKMLENTQDFNYGQDQSDEEEIEQQDQEDQENEQIQGEQEGEGEIQNQNQSVQQQSGKQKQKQQQQAQSPQKKSQRSDKRNLKSQLRLLEPQKNNMTLTSRRSMRSKKQQQNLQQNQKQQQNFYEEQDEQQQAKPQIKNKDAKAKASKKDIEQIYEQNEQNDMEMQNDDISQEQKQQQNQKDEHQVTNYQQFKMSTLDKLKAMAIYQSQYLYMKKHVYQIQEQMANSQLNNQENAQQQIQLGKTSKKESKKGGKNRRKRR